MTSTKLDEHLVLLAAYGDAQRRCTRRIAAQAAEIERLQAELIRVRAAVIVRDSALAITREDLAALTAAARGLPKRVEQADTVHVARIHMSAANSNDGEGARISEKDAQG